jgi:hypothetical protein
MSSDNQAASLNPIAFSPKGEHWIEYGRQRRRVAFHDYATAWVATPHDAVALVGRMLTRE